MSEPILYDEVPYPGHPYAQTHPDRLATMATLFGLDAPSPATSSVLELGCGDGGNLIPMAVHMPAARFVGIDISAPAIARAQEVAAALGLGNIRFEAVGVEDYEPPPASFDYVIAHGVYSWIAAPLRDRLLAVAAGALSERGVAYVSYNTLPGGYARQALREMLAFALAGVDEPAERMAAARALLEEATSLWPGGPGLERTLGGQARMLHGQGDPLFLHDTLAPVNRALYFAEFAGHAAAHGLQFVAEAEYSEMQVRALPDNLQPRVLAMDDMVRREQMLDFYKQRMFRQTLLCHAGHPLDLEARPERVATLAAAGPITATPEDETDRVAFTGSAGSRIATAQPLLVEAFERIAAAWPGAVWIGDLAGGETATDEALAILCGALLPAFAANLVRLHAHPAAVSVTPGRFPRVSPLARLQARDRTLLTTARHTVVHLEDDLGWRLVSLLDGTRDRAALLGELEPTSDGEHANLARDIERSLNTLARLALLLPDDDEPAS
jgi:SAM-dependent methyltransferase